MGQIAKTDSRKLVEAARISALNGGHAPQVHPPRQILIYGKNLQAHSDGCVIPTMKIARSRLLPVTFLIATVAFGWAEQSCQAQTSTQLLIDSIHTEDTRLNVVYKKLMASIPTAAQKEKMKIAQRAWLVWLEGEESLMYALNGNKAGLSTRLDLISARIAQLEDLLRNSSTFYNSKGR